MCPWRHLRLSLGRLHCGADLEAGISGGALDRPQWTQPSNRLGELPPSQRWPQRERFSKVKSRGGTTSGPGERALDGLGTETAPQT
jgi:hypothetical protein